jgi:hypothetical protein
MRAGDKKIGNWLGVAIVGVLGFWGLIIIIRGMVL